MIDRKIYIEPDLDQAIREMASEEDRAYTAQIRVLLREAVQARLGKSFQAPKTNPVSAT